MMTLLAGSGCESDQGGTVNPLPVEDEAPDVAMGGMGGSVASERCAEDLTLPHRDAAELFAYDHVPRFDVFLPEGDRESLIANAVDEQWTRVEACFEGKVIGTIALRFKGSYGTLYSCFDDTGELTCPRLSMKMKFGGFDQDLRFFGLKRLNFHANRYDDSRMKERLACDLYRAMGVPAPRASWGVVRVNGDPFPKKRCALPSTPTRRSSRAGAGRGDAHDVRTFRFGGGRAPQFHRSLERAPAGTHRRVRSRGRAMNRRATMRSVCERLPDVCRASRAGRREKSACDERLAGSVLA